MKKVYFITDFHFGVPDLKDSHLREKRLIAFLNSIKDRCEALFLMGDLFDFWFEYKTVIPKGYARLLGKLAEFTDNGIPVHLFAGNHDLWTFSYLQEEIGIMVHREPEKIKLKGKTFFLVHGDGRGPGDNGYKFLKKVFECRFNQSLFRFLHPDLGIKIALGWSHNHRIKKLEKEAQSNYYSVVEDTRLYKYAASEYEKDNSIDFFVFGHQHKGMQYKTGEHALTTVVGNWIRDFTYAEFDGENVRLLKYEQSQ
ncbi:MAG: UDP-2,3-diacylglucosamine diphosphatase [Candidatus Limimorpha sp.]